MWQVTCGIPLPIYIPPSRRLARHVHRRRASPPLLPPAAALVTARRASHRHIANTSYRRAASSLRVRGSSRFVETQRLHIVARWRHASHRSPHYCSTAPSMPLLVLPTAELASSFPSTTLCPHREVPKSRLGAHFSALGEQSESHGRGCVKGCARDRGEGTHCATCTAAWGGAWEIRGSTREEGCGVWDLARWTEGPVTYARHT